MEMCQWAGEGFGTCEECCYHQAIQALQAQADGDLVSRQAVLEVIRKCHCEEWVKADIGAPIEVLPSITPQPKMGRWIFNEVLDHHYYCSEFNEMGVNYWDYCPNCGSYNGGDAE